MSKEVNDFMQTQGKNPSFLQCIFYTDLLYFFSSGVKPYNFKMNCDSGRPFLFYPLVTIKNIHLWLQYWTLQGSKLRFWITNPLG